MSVLKKHDGVPANSSQGNNHAGVPVAYPGIRKGGGQISERHFFFFFGGLFNFSRGAQLRK